MHDSIDRCIEKTNGDDGDNNEDGVDNDGYSHNTERTFI